MPTAVEVFNRLRSKLGEEEAKILVEFVQESTERGAVTKSDVSNLEATLKEDIRQTKEAMYQLETTLKEDIRQTEEAMHQLEATLKEDIHKLESEVKEDIHQLATAVREDVNRLEKKVADTENRLVRWTFGIWIGNVALISGIVYAIVRAVRP
jgi:flagellar motility protein MotE (MotC chaperone)